MQKPGDLVQSYVSDQLWNMYFDTHIYKFWYKYL